VRTPHGPVSLLVDRVGDVQELANENFSAVPETLQGPARQLIRGAFKLADRLLLSLDADQAVDVTANGSSAQG
jgi:purine-binding chemotaxis protein CheW